MYITNFVLCIKIEFPLYKNSVDIQFDTRICVFGVQELIIVVCSSWSSEVCEWAARRAHRVGIRVRVSFVTLFGLAGSFRTGSCGTGSYRIHPYMYTVYN